MNRNELREQRKQIAQMVKAGKPVPEIVRRFGVSIQTIRNACAEHGVEMRSVATGK